MLASVIASVVFNASTPGHAIAMPLGMPTTVPGPVVRDIASAGNPLTAGSGSAIYSMLDGWCERMIAINCTNGTMRSAGCDELRGYGNPSERDFYLSGKSVLRPDVDVSRSSFKTAMDDAMESICGGYEFDSDDAHFCHPWAKRIPVFGWTYGSTPFSGVNSLDGVWATVEEVSETDDSQPNVGKCAPSDYLSYLAEYNEHMGEGFPMVYWTSENSAFPYSSFASFCTGVFGRSPTAYGNTLNLDAQSEKSNGGRMALTLMRNTVSKPKNRVKFGNVRRYATNAAVKTGTKHGMVSIDDQTGNVYLSLSGLSWETAQGVSYSSPTTNESTIACCYVSNATSGYEGSVGATIRWVLTGESFTGITIPEGSATMTVDSVYRRDGWMAIVTFEDANGGYILDTEVPISFVCDPDNTIISVSARIQRTCDTISPDAIITDMAGEDWPFVGTNFRRCYDFTAFVQYATNTASRATDPFIDSSYYIGPFDYDDEYADITRYATRTWRSEDDTVAGAEYEFSGIITSELKSFRGFVDFGDLLNIRTVDLDSVANALLERENTGFEMTFASSYPRIGIVDGHLVDTEGIVLGSGTVFMSGFSGITDPQIAFDDRTWWHGFAYPIFVQWTEWAWRNGTFTVTE